MAEEIYWLSFRLHKSDGYERTYDQRLQDLNDEIKAASGDGANWWLETTSFFIFRSSESLDTIVARVRRAIDDDVDLVVLRKMNNQSGRVIGACKDKDIFKLVPYMTAV